MGFYIDFLLYLNIVKKQEIKLGYKIRIACLELTCLPKKCQNKLKKQIKEPHEFSAKKISPQLAKKKREE